MIYSYYSLSGNTLVYGPDSLHITAQDLAGALTGLSFYYYLTHDNDVLNDIIRVRNYVFSHYSERDGYLKVTLCPDSTCSENRTDLASYLEQVNDYLLLITPLVERKSTHDTAIEMVPSDEVRSLVQSEFWNLIKIKYKPITSDVMKSTIPPLKVAIFLRNFLNIPFQYFSQSAF